MTERQVVLALGKPHRIAGRRWYYDLALGCQEFIDHVVIRFRRGRVAKAVVDRQITGVMCL